MIGRALDTVIGTFAPAWGARRMVARATMSQIEAFTGGPGGYDGGKTNRATKAWRRAILSENAVPWQQVQNLRARAWDLFRNNPHARKIVRTLESKVVGRGLTPQSQARHADGAPHVEFRSRAQALWQAVSNELDARGKPGRGGQSLADLQRVALRATVLGGEVLYRMKPLATDEQQRRELRLPTVLQLIHAERLDSSLTEEREGRRVYRGIELGGDGERVAYHLLDSHPADPLASGANESNRFSADGIGHLYVADDVDQLRGVSWFAPALLQMRDTGDYQYNELMASAMAACIVLGIRRPSGATKIGLEQPSDWDLTDTDGNRLTAIQPGMMMDLGRDGELDGFNPNRPSTSAEAWIQHMIRSTAAALPGVKSSTLTGDYRNSSFSSERSADNDAWPELEAVQDWFADGFVQPIYEQVIRAGVLAGWFEGVVSPAEFTERKADFLVAHWQGPVARSIKPSEDAEAAKARIRNGTSTPQIEAAALGRNWRDILTQVKEFRDFAQALGIEDDLIDQFLGIEQADQPEVPADDEPPAKPERDAPAPQVLLMDDPKPRTTIKKVMRDKLGQIDRIIEEAV